MTNQISPPEALSDAQLLVEVRRLAGNERLATVQLIAALGELDARRLYLGEGCSSLFAWCTPVLHLSEHAAYGRIEAARAARKWPVVLEMLGEGSLHLTAVALLGRHLTAENHQDLLAAARHKTKREVEEIIAALRPQPAVPASVRKLPEPTTPAPQPPIPIRTPTHVASPAPGVETPGQEFPPTVVRRAEVKPLAPQQYKIQFTVSQDTHQLLREAQDLLRHRIPNGDVGQIFCRALTLLVQDLRRARHAAVDRPRAAGPTSTRTRHIPVAVKRVVWDRDGAQCPFVGASGRCTARGFLEYHHRLPFADGGETTVENLELRCRAHNVYEAERWFGVKKEDLVRESNAVFSGPSLADAGRSEPTDSRVGFGGLFLTRCGQSSLQDGFEKPGPPVPLGGELCPSIRSTTEVS